MTKLADWDRCNELYCNYMGYEAAESGYDMKAAFAAKMPYLEAITDYKLKHGEVFNPYSQPAEEAA